MTEEDIKTAFEAWTQTNVAQPRSAFRAGVSVGLIEAATIAEEWDSGWGEDRNTRVARQTAFEIAEAIRDRAARAGSCYSAPARPDDKDGYGDADCSQ